MNIGNAWRHRGIITLIACWALASETTLGQGAPSDRRPNIVVLLADDMGYGDLSCYGGDIPTPNIDAIASQGIRFTNFYVSYPACTPSRYSLLTGRNIGRAQHGLDNVLMPGSAAHLDPSEKILPEFLQPEGYATGMFGKWHLGGPDPRHLPTGHGFQEFTGHVEGCLDYFTHVYGGMGNSWLVDGVPGREEGYSTDLIAAHAVDFIDRNVRRNRRFFLYVPFNAPHYGKTDPANIPDGTLVMEEKEWKGHRVANTLQAPRAYLQRFAHVKDEYRRHYAAMVASLDDNVGKILDQLRRTGQWEQTMIWFASDNGGYSVAFRGHASNGPLRGQKGNLYEGGIRVPGMVCWPARIRAARTSDQVVSTLDVLPTLAAILGFKDALQGLPIDGRDMSDALFAGARVERQLIWQKNGPYAIRDGKWKLVTGKGGTEELYNLDTDISERNDVAGMYPEKVKQLHHAYQRYAASIPPRRAGGPED